MKIRPFFRWNSLWIGAYWNPRERALCVSPFPMIGLRIEFNSARAEQVRVHISRRDWHTAFQDGWNAAKRNDAEVRELHEAVRQRASEDRT